MRFSCRLSPSTGLSLTFVAFLSTLIAFTVKSRSLVRLCLILIILLSDIIYGAHLLPARSLAGRRRHPSLATLGHRRLARFFVSLSISLWSWSGIPIVVCLLPLRTCRYAWAFPLGNEKLSNGYAARPGTVVCYWAICYALDELDACVGLGALS